MNVTRVQIDLLAFQQLCRGEIANSTGSHLEDGNFTEPPIELALQDIGFDQMLLAVQLPANDLIDKHQLLNPSVFAQTLDNMDKWGGSFVKQLSAMARRADSVNRAKCVVAWSNYFVEYSKDR